MSDSKPFTEKAESCDIVHICEVHKPKVHFWTLSVPLLWRGGPLPSERAAFGHFGLLPRYSRCVRSDERGTLQTPHSRILGIAARTGDAVIEHVALVKQSRRTGSELHTTSPIPIRSTSGVGGPSGAFVFSLILALRDQNNIWNVMYVPCTFVLQRRSLWHANNSLKTSVASV